MGYVIFLIYMIVNIKIIRYIFNKLIKEQNIMKMDDFKKDVVEHCVDIEDKYVKEVIKMKLSRMTEKRWKLLYNKFVIKMEIGEVICYKEMYKYVKQMKELKTKEN